VNKNPQQQAAIADLKKWLSPGSTVWTVQRHTSKSCLSHWIDLYTIQDNEPIRLTYLVCVACGYSYCSKREALKTQGGGMDMGFQDVYDLGSTLWPDCTDAPHRIRTGEPDSHGGYALSHRWLG